MSYRRRHSRKNRLKPFLSVISVLIVAGALWAVTTLFGDGQLGLSPNSSSPDSTNQGSSAKPSDNPSATASPDQEPAKLDQPTASELAATYDVVVSNGRVINPETKLDREGLNVGIKDGKIALVTDQKLKGEREIDATGLIVSPGFIDNLSYDPNPVGVWNKIADGVTANIAMHGGTDSPHKWYPYYIKDRTPVHFGASFFYTQARNKFKLSRYDTAKPEQTQQLVDQAEKALNDGALGISFSLEYVPGVNDKEILPMMRLAQKYNVPVYFHARYSDMEEPGTNIDALNEILGYARTSGAAVHIDHINSTGGTFSMKQSLDMVAAAIAEGLDVTSCIYPYDYWGTYLNSARFDEGWQERFRIDYEDLQIAGTNERLTAESFRKYQQQGKLAVAYAIPKQDVIDSLKAPYVMMGSDAILEPGFNNHPRASGTFARTVGLYVREQGVISLSDAIAKMSLMPAQRLERQSPALKKKGRIVEGMDADIVVFDYDTITDKSTVEKPQIASEGIKYVLINGQIALDENGVNKDVRAGQPLKTEFLRVKESGVSLAWEDDSIPVLAYRGVDYVNVDSLRAHGYAYEWDKVKHTFNVTSSGNEPAANGERIAKPKSGALMVERGYKMRWEDGSTAELLSVEDDSYVSLTALEAQGWKLSKEGTNYALSAK